jgi:hypothetical protein
MAALDFPASPVLGDRYPTPAVAGKPQYSWDGEKWTTASGSTTTAPPASATPLEDNATPQVGITTKYAREDHVHPSTALKYSAQTLTTAQQEQSRKNIYAAPFDAQAYSGMQINGAMEVSQERGNTTYTPGPGTMTYIQDGWRFYSGSAPLVFSVLPQMAPSGGMPSGLFVQSTTPKPTMAAGDQIFIEQPVEGYRITRLNWGTPTAQPITIGFLAFSASITGTMTVAILNGASNRTYLTNVVINTPNTWEYKTVTIPGDTAGTWARQNTTGLFVRFCFGAGTSVQGAAGTWLATGVSATSATTNFHSVSNYTGITGVIVLPGIEAPSAERSPLIVRPYDQELLTCMRYWEKTLASILGYQIAGQTLFTNVNFIPKRAIPTTSTAGGFTSTSNATAAVLTDVTVSSLALSTNAVATGTALIRELRITLDARL